MTALLLLGAAISNLSCEGEPLTIAERVLSSTVSLSRESQLTIDTVVPLVITGNPRQNQLIAKIELTATASASDVAERIAQEAELEVTLEGKEAKLTLAPPKVGFLSGRFTLEAPADMDLTVIQRGGTVDVTGMRETISVQSYTHVNIVDARADVSVGVENGNALVDTRLSPSTNTLIRTRSGDIQLTIPDSISANINATGGAGVAVSHPQLPMRPANLPYQVSVGNGLASVVIQAGGKVVIRN